MTSTATTTTSMISGIGYEISSCIFGLAKTMIWGTAQGVGFYCGIIVMKRLQSSLVLLSKNTTTNRYYKIIMNSWLSSFVLIENENHDDHDDKNNSQKKKNMTAPIPSSSSSSSSNNVVIKKPMNQMTNNNSVSNNATTNNDELLLYGDSGCSIVSSRSASIGNETEATTGVISMGPSRPPPPTRYVEMLIHNVAHTDLVLSLGTTSSSSTNATNSNTTTTSYDDEPRKGNIPYNNNSENIPYNNNSDEDNIITPRKGNIAYSNSNLGSKKPPLLLCRPRFSAFDLFCRRIHSHLSRVGVPSIISFPRYERNDASPRYSLVTPRPSRQMHLPVGLSSQVTVSRDELPSLRIRGRDVEKVEGLDEMMKRHQRNMSGKESHTKNGAKSDSKNGAKSDPKNGAKSDPKNGAKSDSKNGAKTDSPSSLHINAVFFPLLSTLLARWTKTINEKFNTSNSSNSNNSVKKVIILVSGVGTPRNFTHSINGNSTEYTAALMEEYLKIIHPDVTVVRLHSETNIFRYDDNICFAKSELLPCVEGYRDAHAHGWLYPDEQLQLHPCLLDTHTGDFDQDWKKSFRVTLSFADGSPARTHAIQSALRPYRPTYFHIWQLKTFWHETKISDEDVEVHSFEDMCTIPAIDVCQVTSTKIKSLIQELKLFKIQFLNSLMGRNDIRSFWLRKTKKPVLAVLLVEVDGRPRIYRGTNMEVSMPTGSLCAERNVIGTVLASHPGLKREDLKMVAVLAVPLPELEEDKLYVSTTAPLDQHETATATATAALLKDVSDKLNGHDPECNRAAPVTLREGIPRTMSVTSCASIVEETREDREDDNIDIDNHKKYFTNDTNDDDDDDDIIVMNGNQLNNNDPLEFSWIHANTTTTSITTTLSSGGGGGSPLFKLSSSPTPPKDDKTSSFSSSSPGGKDGMVLVPPLNLCQNVASPPSTPVQRRISLYGHSNDDDDDNNNNNVVMMINNNSNSNNTLLPTAMATMEDSNTKKNNKISKKKKLTMGSGGRRGKKRTVVVHCPKDINPLAPCGACNEWLKKIAEHNPYFKVLTFTDADCNGVYINSCQE